MSDRKPLNSPTADAPQDANASTTDPALIGLKEDLQAYDNPEVFYDTTLPFTPKTRIFTALLENQPDVLRVEIEGNTLWLAIRELTMRTLWHQATKMDPTYTQEDFLKDRADGLEDPVYLKIEEDMFYFFVRNFPQLLLRIYQILNRLTLVYGSRTAMNPAQRQAFEADIKNEVMAQVRELRNDIKKMLQTRSSGRPRKIEIGPLPEIVKNVLDTAEQLMGERRGREAVPGLKTIADRLGTTEDALGQRLRRSGLNWTTIRLHLESLT